MTMLNPNFHRLQSSINSSLACGWLGPPLEDGKHPGVFYFALSLEDTLLTDPFNSLAAFLHKKNPNLRVFSVTLPFHSQGNNEQMTVSKWLEAVRQNPNFFNSFFNSLCDLKRFIDPVVSKWTFSGLSRGAWVAGHLAARQEDQAIPLALLAPMTTLTTEANAQNFFNENLDCWGLEHLPLAHHPIWISIGHQDTRVGTDRAIAWMQALCRQQPVTRSQHQLVIYPSIGYKGHGTPPKIFEAAAAWICQQCSATGHSQQPIV